jgi:transposase
VTMFVREVKVRQAGKTYTYLRLVESVRENGKLSQKVLLHLGQADLAWGKASAVMKALAPIARSPYLPPGELAEKLKAETAREFGVTLVGNHLWKLAGLTDILKAVAPRVANFDRTEALIRAMVLNRLSDPESKYGIFRWFKKADIGPGDELLSFYTQKNLADRFYRAMDVLLPKQKAIEDRVYLNLRTLFSIELDLVFYDITSTYFEGKGPQGLAERGYSRDHRHDRPQIVIGLLMADGLPVAHHVFKGATKDSTTVEGVLDDLITRFNVRKVIFVGDRGMMTDRIIKAVRERRQEYLFALKRRRCGESQGVLDEPFDDAVLVDGKINVKEFPSEDGDRLIVCRNGEQAAYDASRRQDIMTAVEKDLKALQAQVESGRFRSMKRIVSKAAVILSRRNGNRYFDFEARTGYFRYFRKEESLKLEGKLDGTYVLKTNNRSMGLEAIVHAYRDELSNVDRAFKNLKGPIELRPVNHRLPHRVKSHVFICVLSFLLECMLQQKLDSAGVKMTALAALDTMKSMHIVKDRIEDLAISRVTEPTKDHEAILAALGLKPPRPFVGERSGKTNACRPHTAAGKGLS